MPPLIRLLGLFGLCLGLNAWGLTADEVATLDDLHKRNRTAPDEVIATVRARLAAGNLSAEYAAHLWFTLADTCLQKGDFATADETAGTALTTYGDSLPTLVRADLLSVRAALPWRQGNLSVALDFVLQAYRLAQTAPDDTGAPTLARCANRLGILYSNFGKPDEALTYYQEALRLNRTARAPPLQIASILGNIGLLYHSLNNLDEAVRYQSEAVDLYRAGNDPFGLARNTVNLAITRGQRGENDAALTLIDEALATQRELNDTRGQSSALLARADIENRMRQPAACLETVAAALVLLEADEADSEIVDARVIATRALQQMGRLEEALTMGRTAAELAAAVGIARATASIQHLLAELHEAHGDATAALAAERAAAAAESELLDARRQDLVTVLEIEYAAAERERTLAVLRAQNAEQALVLQSEQNLRRNVMVAAAAVTILALLLLYGYRVKARYSHRLERSNADLAALSAEKSALMDMAAHDLRGPLTTVRWQAEATLRQGERATPVAVREALTAIAATAGTMHAKVSQLLDAQRAESAEPLGPVAPLDLRDWLQARADFASTAAAAKSITLTVEAPAGLIARTSADALATIVDNLVGNALKFSPRGAAVRLRAAASGDAHRPVRVSVADDGPGIPVAEQPYLFAKYRRLSPRPTDGEASSGLGLAIVKQLCDRLDITITVTSAPGEGTRFDLHLPRADTIA